VDVLDGKSLANERKVKLPGTGTVVQCRADNIQVTVDGIFIQRLKASRLAKQEKEKPRHILLQAAVSHDHAGTDVYFEHVSLLTRERRPSRVDQNKLSKQLTVINETVEAVAAGNFDPSPDDHCPACPYFFICPSHGAIV
jgi:hypothetical protein